MHHSKGTSVDFVHARTAYLPMQVNGNTSSLMPIKGRSDSLINSEWPQKGLVLILNTSWSAIDAGPNTNILIKARNQGTKYSNEDDLKSFFRTATVKCDLTPPCLLLPTNSTKIWTVSWTNTIKKGASKNLASGRMKVHFPSYNHLVMLSRNCANVRKFAQFNLSSVYPSTHSSIGVGVSMHDWFGGRQ